LPLELSEPVTEGSAVLSLLDGGHDAGDLSFERWQFQGIGFDLLATLRSCTIDLLLKGSDELPAGTYQRPRR
jgi:hypothetical protein